VMSENFTALMRQVHRKYGVDVSGAYLTVFDYISLADWDANKSTETFAERRAKLEKIFAENKLVGVELIEQREIDNDLNQVIACQKEWEALGFEGAMVKNPNAPYAFGRSDSVLKVKSFFDIDLPVIGFKEGVGRHVGSLGSILVDNSGVEVNVGSGFSDEQRVEIWNNQDRYLGLIAELRAQETTEDGSLRFPTFVCWRVDKN
jgi:DNA ligase 1